MSKRTSRRPVKTQGKRARKDAVGDGDFKPEHDANFEDEQEQKSPPRKRQRVAPKFKAPPRKKQDQGKSSSIVRLPDIPTSIIIKIMSHLLPINIIFLARVNKFFRNLLMNRSSVDIWHRAMDNVPFLPECPPDMSEPRYLALVFLNTCTSCGKAGKLEVDEVLRVRLCGSLVVWNTVTPGIMALIPFSGKIAPTPRRSNAYSLRGDVPSLLAEYEAKKKLGDKTFQTWAAEKRKIKDERLKHAQMLKAFLGIMELADEQEMEDIKAERQKEIERRLGELGWTSEDLDFDFPECTNKRTWLDLISQPKPLSDQGWTTLKPALTTLLETNRQKRSEIASKARKKERETRLSEMFLAIEERGTLTVSVSSHNPDSEAPTSFTFEPPFPNLSHTLNCPAVMDLYETDRTVVEMEAKFEQHRAEIEGFLIEWTNQVQSHFIKLAHQGPKIGKKILQSTSIVHDNKSDPFAKLPDDVKRLLRADSFFNSTSLFGFGQCLTYGHVLRVEGFRELLRTATAVSSSAPPNLDHVRWDSEANEAARVLLTGLGKPNASYLEMTGQAIYKCGRCHDSEAKTWGEMVRHYVHEKRQYARIQERLRSDPNVTYNNVHDPKLRTKQPLVQYVGVQSTDESELFECRICPELPILQDVVASETQILSHFLDVHGIADPELHEQYGPQEEAEAEAEDELNEVGRYDSDDGFGLFDERFSDDEFSEGGGCAYARRRLAGYGGYGRRRRYNAHYSRPRCLYDGGDDDWW
ncbi:unnamed protein product [Rhizoctonia solani]|uniref:F-box domain-containing protein n=1 Tax=Rhizoctonia solani TaxID=456999 RepID=A0A8H3HPK1_9AGAM|nr:unnamed protein product [Rhizoctonia solani]